LFEKKKTVNKKKTVPAEKPPARGRVQKTGADCKKFRVGGVAQKTLKKNGGGR